MNSCGHLNAVTRLCNLDFVIKMTHYDNNTIIIVIIVIIIIIFITVDGWNESAAHAHTVPHVLPAAFCQNLSTSLYGFY